MNALIIGYGSIGRRHAAVLTGLGLDVAVVSRRDVDAARTYGDLPTALDHWRPGYVVIASRTNEHFDDLATLAATGFDGRVLMEKPLFDSWREPPSHRFAQIGIGYGLRFHPLILRLRDVLADQPRLVAAHVYVGQDLRQWRPGSDYRDSYSARRAEGGGVLRDLSHELDYVQWLFGHWSRLTALGGQFSPLAIDSDDVYSLLLETPRCPVVTVQMNYLDRTLRREVLVHTDRHSVRIDLVRGTFELDGRMEAMAPMDRDHIYVGEHRAMLAGDGTVLCSLEEGLEVMRTIAAAEEAAATGKWIVR